MILSKKQNWILTINPQIESNEILFTEKELTLVVDENKKPKVTIYPNNTTNKIIHLQLSKWYI